MCLSQLLTSQVLTCTVNGCKSNTRRYLVYLIFFVARLDNKWWVVQNSSPEINTRIQKKIGPHRCLPHSQTSRQSLGWSWSSHGPDCQILQKKNSSSVHDVDVKKIRLIVDLGRCWPFQGAFFKVENPRPPTNPQRSQVPKWIFVSPFLGCFRSASVVLMSKDLWLQLRKWRFHWPANMVKLAMGSTWTLNGDVKDKQMDVWW